MVAGSSPYKLSPVHRVLEERAPAWVEIDGWKVPARFGPVEAEIHSVSSRVGLCDLTFHTKWEFRGRDLNRAFPDLPRVGCVAVHSGEYLCRTTHEQVPWIGSVPHQDGGDASTAPTGPPASPSFSWPGLTRPTS